MRLAVLAAVLAAAPAALAVGSAGAVAERTALIRPGASIGKIRLGMTQAELLRAMGPPRAVVRRPAGFGFRSLEFEYGFAEYTARLFGRPGRLRVVRATTTLFRERTRAGIGAGSRERALRRVYPRVRCGALRADLVVAGITRDCTLVAPSGRRTSFMLLVRVNVTIGERLSDAQWRRRARVAEVSVSEPS